MNDDEVYFNILEFLAKKGIHKYEDVFDQFEGFVTEPPSEADQSNGHRAVYINSFLNIMKGHGHIDCLEYSYDRSDEVDIDWMGIFPVSARIEQAGLDYYQTLLVNRSSIKSFHWQKRAMRITIILTIIAVAVSIVNLYFTSSKTDESKAEILKLQRQLDSLKSKQKPVINQKALTADSSRKP